jgi:hypothetical protein
VPIRGGFQGLGSTWSGYLSGFPIYSGAARGFGAYPTAPEEPRGALRPPLPRLEPPREGDWPSWIDIAAERRGLPPISPLRAVLVQSSDRVWYRERGETAFVPLAFHDRFRLIEPNATALVRDQGEMVVVFHEAGQIRTLGPCEMTVVDLTPDIAEIALPQVALAWVTARARKLRLRLPDGSELECQDGACRLQQVGAKLEIENRATTPLLWRGQGRTVTVEPVQMLRLLAAAPARPPIPAALATGGAVEQRREGRAIVARGGAGGGTVEWSGVRIRLGEGEEVRLDPLAGTTFPDSRPAEAPDGPAR